MDKIKFLAFKNLSIKVFTDEDENTPFPLKPLYCEIYVTLQFEINSIVREIKLKSQRQGPLCLTLDDDVDPEEFYSTLEDEQQEQLWDFIVRQCDLYLEPVLKDHILKERIELGEEYLDG